jgi:hypothetical protein
MPYSIRVPPATNRPSHVAVVVRTEYGFHRPEGGYRFGELGPRLQNLPTLRHTKDPQIPLRLRNASSILYLTNE